MCWTGHNLWIEYGAIGPDWASYWSPWRRSSLQLPVTNLIQCNPSKLPISVHLLTISYESFIPVHTPYDDRWRFFVFSLPHFHQTLASLQHHTEDGRRNVQVAAQPTKSKMIFLFEHFDIQMTRYALFLSFCLWYWIKHIEGLNFFYITVYRT